MNETGHRYVSWRQPRWSYMPGLWSRLAEHFTVKGFCYAAPLELLLAAAICWRDHPAIFARPVSAGSIVLLGAAYVHLVLGIGGLCLVGLRWALPFPEGSACNVLGLSIRFAYGIEDKDFDRARLIVFSDKVARLRAYAGGRSAVADIPPSVDLDLLVDLLPGQVEVWDARSKFAATH